MENQVTFDNSLVSAVKETYKKMVVTAERSRSAADSARNWSLRGGDEFRSASTRRDSLATKLSSYKEEHTEAVAALLKSAPEGTKIVCSINRFGMVSVLLEKAGYAMTWI